MKPSIITRRQYGKTAEPVQAGKTTGQNADKAKKPTTTKTGTSTSSQQHTPTAELPTVLSGIDVVEVVYLEPTNFSQPTVKFPVEVARILNERNIEYLDIIRVGRLRFKITFGSELTASVLRKQNLGKHNLKCFVPFLLRQTIGIVRGIPTEYKDEEVADSIESDVEIMNVERMKKMDSEGELEDTANMKIIFKGNKLPDEVTIFRCKHRVELYIFPVKQCQNCWAYGHKAKQCKRKEKCRSCGKEKHQGNCEAVKCINCGGSHNATERECPRRKEQKEISEVMQRDKLTFREAKKKCTNENPYGLLPDNDEDFPGLSQNTNQQSRNTNYSSQYRTIPSQRTRGRTQHQQQGYRSFAQVVAEEDVPHEFVENPHKTGQWERTVAELKRFWKNLNVVRKLMKLHLAINAEIVTKEASAIAYEELIVRISTTLQDIIEEITNELAEVTEESMESHENMECNG